MKAEFQKALSYFIETNYPSITKEQRLLLLNLIDKSASTPENIAKFSKLSDDMALTVLIVHTKNYCEDNLFMSQLENSLLKARLASNNNTNFFSRPDSNLNPGTPNSEPHTPDSKSRSQTPSPPKNLLGTAR